MSVSIIIPTLDEAARIGARLDELAGQGFEVLVVDGGSHDGTVEIARARSGVRVLTTPRSRGAQLSAGAAAASGDVLLFLHADTTLPADARTWIERAFVDPAVVAGAFRVRTVADAGRRNWLGPFLRIADIRSHVTRLPYGDQALFVRRRAFDAVGGFPDEPLMEDVGLVRRLRRVGRVVTVPAYVRASGRRFLKHPIAGTLAMWTFPTLHRLGVSGRMLARLYGNPR